MEYFNIKLDHININNKPLSSSHQKIIDGVNLAIKNELDKHRRLNQSISIYQDGKIITLKGEEIAKFLDDN